MDIVNIHVHVHVHLNFVVMIALGVLSLGAAMMAVGRCILGSCSKLRADIWLALQLAALECWPLTVGR